MMEQVEFRKLGVDDAELLSELAIQAYSDHYLHLWYDQGKWYIHRCFTVKALRAELSDANTLFYFALYNQVPAGFLKLNINTSLNGEEDKNALELERLYLRKKFVGKGIGKKLVELTFKIAKEFNKDIVWLKAMDSSNEAITFYRKMGFNITGTQLLTFETMKEEFRGMVIMSAVI
jgi:ribosomal protein S18 acetylase RimI-like enzyme